MPNVILKHCSDREPFKNKHKYLLKNNPTLYIDIYILVYRVSIVSPPYLKERNRTTRATRTQKIPVRTSMRFMLGRKELKIPPDI